MGKERKMMNRIPNIKLKMMMKMVWKFRFIKIRN